MVSVRILGSAKPGLAQSAEQSAALEGLLWVGAIVMAFLVVVVLHHFRKKVYWSRQESQAGFRLDELRHLRDQGSSTLAAYEAIMRKSLHRSEKSLT